MTPSRERGPREHRARRAAAAALLTAALATLAASPAAAAPRPHVAGRTGVLVLHSYSPDFVWTQSQQEGIDSVFDPLAAAYDLRIEYLDAVHHPELMREPLVLELLRAKLAHLQFRVVLASDNAAFDFARAHRAELFPGVPIVFMGVNGFGDATLRGERGITGVAEDSDLAGTLRTLVQLVPHARRVVFPGMSDDLTYRAIRGTVAKDLAALPPDVKTEFVEYPNIDAALEELAALPPDTAIVVMANMRTADGEGITSQRVVELISAAAAVPVFTNWDFVVGHGAVGGSVISGVEQGRRAAELAVRVLAGESPDAIPVQRGAGKTLLFDHRQLERFQISPARLPPGAVVLFAPERTLRISQEVATVAGVSFAVLLVVAASLVVAVRRRRRAELRLREANERFEAMLRALTDYAVIGTDLVGRVLTFSDGAELMLGYAADEVLGRPVTLIHDPAEVAERAAELGVPPGFDAFVTVARLGRTETREWTYVRKDGTRFPVVLTAAAMRGADGALLGFIGIARDVTEQRRMQQQLLQSQKMESLGLLAGGVAHDFNNLLTPILGHASILLDDAGPTDGAAEPLREIQEAARRASELTRQLLAFSRKQMLELKAVAVGEVLRGAERMLRRILGENIQIEVSVAEDLALVRADAGQLEQVLVNLAINARDAMPGGGRLGLSLRNVVLDDAAAAPHPELHPGRWVHLEVTDTGVGMAPDVLAHLFEPFFTTKERGKGTGLGLSMVYGIVKQHGGTVIASSTPGQGATFRVYLPALEGAAHAAPSQPLPAAGVPRGAGETILVVEDSDPVRLVAGDMLRRLGYRVLSAPDGEHALALGDGPEAIQLLLTDVVLPRINGKEVATRLCARRPDLRVLYMSGYAADVIVHQGVLDEGVSFIQKPLHYDALARKVRALLDERQLVSTG
jgi:PAS domain S-box-containing protein